MTITERKGLTSEFVSRPTAETSTGQLHIIKFFCSGGRVGRNEQFSDFSGRHGRHYTSQGFVPQVALV